MEKINNTKKAPQTNSKKPIKKLGRGMSALGGNSLLQKKIETTDTSVISNTNISQTNSSKTQTTKQSDSNLIYLDIQKIKPNPNQPRTLFDEEKINALSQSIKNQGILQPLLVTKKTQNMYSIIAGERRYRAAKKAGLKILPVLILELNEEQILETAIVENLQREDLNPIEMALSFQNLIRISDITHETLANQLGISRSRVTNTLRLLSLPKNIQKALEENIISASHARTILTYNNEKQQQNIFEKIIKENISVHDLSSIVKKTKKISKNNKNTNTQDIHLKEYQQQLLEFLGTNVQIIGNLEKGAIKIEYYNKKDLSRILQLLNSNKN